MEKDAYHHYHFIHGWNDNDWWDDWDDWDRDHDGPVELKMTIDGLDNIHIEKKPRRHEERRGEDSLQDNYRYHSPEEKQDNQEKDQQEEKTKEKPVTPTAASINAGMEVPAVESASLIIYSVYNMLK